MSLPYALEVHRELKNRSKAENGLKGQIGVYKRALDRISDERKEERAAYEKRIAELEYYMDRVKHNLSVYQNRAEVSAREVSSLSRKSSIKGVLTDLSAVDRFMTDVHPLMMSAVLRFNSYVDEFNPGLRHLSDKGIVDVGWMAFSDEFFNAESWTAHRLPFVYPGQGLSMRKNGFEPLSSELGPLDFHRLNALYYAALAIAVYNSTVLIETATGIYQAVIAEAHGDVELISQVAIEFSEASKSWRSYASRPAGDMRDLVFPILNQLIEIANHYPSEVWGYEQSEVDIHQYLFPIGIFSGTIEGLLNAKSHHLAPKTKMQNFIIKYGVSSDVLRQADESRILIIHPIYADRAEQIFEMDTYSKVNPEVVNIIKGMALSRFVESTSNRSR